MHLLTFAVAAAITVGGLGDVSDAPAADHLRVALLQLLPDSNDIEANAEKARVHLEEAAEAGADIALLPEMWSIGYTRFDPDKPGDKEHFYTLARAKDSEYVQQFARLAGDLGMAIGFAYLEAHDPLPRNTLTLFDRHGEEVLSYSKVHTSDFKSMERSMTPGADFYVNTLDTAKGPVAVGAMICFDREQPESARILMLKGAEIVLTPNACRLRDIQVDQFKVRAFENVMGVAMANYPFPQHNGRSVAFDAEGNELVEAGPREGIYYADFGLQALRARRRKVIWGNAYRRPHRYGILTETERDPVWHRIDGIGKSYDPSVR
ncbi:MAG: carbon-nitrogen hydrolase family protein [Candidatus Hydrogenedentota bacterium]